MPADRLLTTVLRAYQDPPSPAETDKILGTTNSLLTTLNNPLNISLLTSHFLTARAIWQAPDGLRTCLRVLSIYNTAAIHVRRNELDNATRGRLQPPTRSGVHAEDWARAVAKGLDERSSRWQHTLVLAGILMGMEGEDRRSLSGSLRSTLEHAVVTAANLSLAQDSSMRTDRLGIGAVVLALTYAFQVMSPAARGLLNCDLLLPAIIEVMLGDEGFQHGDFIRDITINVAGDHARQWPPFAPSVARLQRLESRPLIQNMGPLSRLAVFAVENAASSDIILHAQDELLTFSAGLLEKWTRCPLATIDLSVEDTALAPDVLHGPWAMLWQLMKKIMYAVVATLQPILGRSLLDPPLRNDAIAPSLVSKTLHILRNLSFISSRQSAGSFQVYTFTYLTSLDILSRYPDACAAFLRETGPPSTPMGNNAIPPPVTQALTLFYLNTAEHLPLSLPTSACEVLIIAPATAHLSPNSWLSTTATASSPTKQPSLTLELFESAHSAILSVLSCPQHSDLTASIIPFYIDTLLSSFPARISPRQFRVAFRTVIQIASPPFPIAASHPELSETLLEMLWWRAVEDPAVSMMPILPPSSSSSSSITSSDGQISPSPAEANETITEQSALVLSLIDALPYLRLPIVEEWLTRVADAMNSIVDVRAKDTARKRFWDVLAGGDMDVERAAVGVAWWGLKGGREMVLFGRRSHGLAGAEGDREESLMSGALPPTQGREGIGDRGSRL